MKDHVYFFKMQQTGLSYYFHDICKMLGFSFIHNRINKKFRQEYDLASTKNQNEYLNVSFPN